MIKIILNKIKLPLFIIIFFVGVSFLWGLLNLPPEEKLIEMAREYFEKYGMLTVFFAAIIEGALLAGWYVPGGLVIFLGVILSNSPAQAILSVFATIMGFLIAYIFNFYVGKYGWYKVLLRFGVKNSLEKAQKEFNKYGFKTIYISYWEPNLASLVSTAAGIARAPFKKFFLVSLIATVMWAIFWGSMAYIFGSQILEYLGGVFFGIMILWIIYIIVKHKKNKVKLICFDLDQTLIDHSSWRELGLALGISYEEDERLKKEYESGKFSYDDWNNKILELYMRHSDSTRENITKILSNYSYKKGAREIVSYLKEKGYTLVLISGSINILVDIVAKDLGIKYAKANNTFVFDEQDRIKSISSYGDEIVAKANHLESIAEMLGVDIKECACIADGENDIEMFRRTSHGITFKGSNIENEAWKVVDSFEDLRSIF